MPLAPVAYCLWQRHLRFDPADPIWPDRDRFVLSNGHASMLLYSLLHLTGVQAVNPKYEITGKPSVSLEDIKAFRQLGSRCPGHPEYRWTSGVESTTGPLGQGVATSVGMAAAGRWLAEQDSPQAHGEPLGEEEVRAAKRFYGWPEDAHFLVPDGVYEHFREGIGRRGARLRAEWFALFGRYREAHPDLADEVYRTQHRQLPEGWDKGLPSFPPDPEGLASRDSSGQVLNVLAGNVPWLLGGRPTCTPPPRPGSFSPAPVTSRLATTPAGTSTSASASTRCA
jgi:transketolase